VFSNEGPTQSLSTCRHARQLREERLTVSVGYLELLRRRKALRAVWLAQVVSLAGDWFSLIALYELLERYTGRGEAVGLLLLCRFLPAPLLGPLAGVVADRLPRGAVMVAADVGRAVVVLGFATVAGPDDVSRVYALTFAQMTLAAFFDPAEQAAIAAAVEPDEVVTATTLSGITWSAMLSVGAVAGGLVTHLAGPRIAFTIDATSYLASAALVLSARLPAAQRASSGQSTVRASVSDLQEAWHFVAGRRQVLRTLWVKSGWALAGGGAILTYALLGERVFSPGPGRGSVGVGTLLAMRGVGAFIGPLVARRRGGDGADFLEKAIGIAFIVTAGSWLLVALSPTLPVAAVLLACAHTGISTQWVFSSSLLVKQVPDALRGRLFALDNMASLFMLGLSSWLTGLAIDRAGLTPRLALMAMAGVVLFSGALWWSLRPSAATAEGEVQR
jgi:MFS family permease